KRANIPWDEPPNKAPCKNWRDCGRRYKIVEYDTSQGPWKELNQFLLLNISADGATWVDN
ncbi:MAG: hypothetical protein AAF485_32690, partial [Chloroflexota bacterium]